MTPQNQDFRFMPHTQDAFPECATGNSCPVAKQLQAHFEIVLKAELQNIERSVENLSSEVSDVAAKVDALNTKLEGSNGLHTRMAVIEATEARKQKEGNNTIALIGLIVSVAVLLFAVFQPKV